jgi:[acyl-carrier-protein] S-malonyltransferase
VISGHKPALERAILGAKAAGAKRALPLAVSIAAHSPLMASIQTYWNEAVNATKFQDPVIPIVGNVSADTVTSALSLQNEVINQMQSRVKWTDCVKMMSSLGVAQYVEVGPGSVLGGLVKRIVSYAVINQIGEDEDFQ